ncbi:MAG: hypothetical protein HeimC3_03380 [Candidatus Heimdallarchaeota archaeon LC_3]|nr:MAG: hypothetical protein HeimC3_03380 [Candidatus Heimdallarchaeota archaeon LC_3]
MFYNTRNNPLKEITLIYVASFFILLMEASFLINPLLSTPNNLNLDSVFFDRLGFFFGELGLVLIVYAVILVDFKMTYRSFFQLNFVNLLIFSNMAYTALNIEIKVVGNFILTNYTLLGSFLFLSQFVLIVLILIKRIRTVLDIKKSERASPITSRIWLIIFVMIAISTLSFYSISRFLFPGALPNYTYMVFISILFIYFALSIHKDKAFFFITSVSLNSIIMIEQRTGLVFQGISYQSEVKLPEELVSGIFSMLNISLKDTVKSDSKLEEIRFGDKVVLMNHGKIVTTLLIVSETNFVTKSIASYLTYQFEKSFLHSYENEMRIILNKDNYKEFQEVFKFVREFIPI